MKGHYKLSLAYGGQCPGPTPQHQVDYLINPDRTFAVRVHVRDHIGTSAMSRLSSTYAPVPNLDNAIHIGTMTLFAHDIEYSTYEPCGKRVNTGVQFKGDPRYTDHEIDGFNTVKGPAFALDCVDASARRAIPTAQRWEVQSTGPAKGLELDAAAFGQSL